MKNMLRRYNPLIILLTGSAFGLAGLSLIVDSLSKWPVSPEYDRRLLFFAAIWLLLAGIVLPPIWFLHRRFGRPSAGEDWHSLAMLLRQANWVGLWATGCAWLQMQRSLNWAMALLLLIVLLLLESLLLMRRGAKQE